MNDLLYKDVAKMLILFRLRCIVTPTKQELKMKKLLKSKLSKVTFSSMLILTTLIATSSVTSAAVHNPCINKQTICVPGVGCIYVDVNVCKEDV